MFPGKWLVMLLMSVWCVAALANDPTRPPNLAPVATELVHEPLRLSLVLSEGERRTAVVNGKVLAVSDWIGSAQVLAIRDDQVLMRRAGQRFVLRLPVAAIKKDMKGGQHE